MCGGKKSAPAPQVLPAPPAPPGYTMDSGGVIRDAPATPSPEAQQATFGSELAGGQS